MSYKIIRKYSSDIHLYEFNPNEERLSLEVGVRRKLEMVSEIGKPNLDENISCRINAGFFNFSATSEHLGLLISNGLYYSPPHINFIDLIYSKDKIFSIEKVENTLARLNYLQANSIFACGSSFSLIQKGTINLENCKFFEHYIYRNPRTAIGQKANKNIVLCVVDGRTTSSLGVTGQQLAQIMLDERCINAVNFDGGGSSIMVLGNKVISHPSDGVPRKGGSAFVVYEKKQTQYPVLRLNSTQNSYVKILQKILISLGYDLGKWGADGLFGTQTYKAVKSYQQKKNLVVDGVVGKMTWNSLLGKGV